MEECDYSIGDPEAFLRRVKNVEYGLSAEVEFAAVLRWLGVCQFVHRLNKETLADKGAEWVVPDLLAVFARGDIKCSAVIEVKTTSGLTLPLRREYLERLRGYAELVSQPLLLAWRSRKVGSWILVDPLVMESEGVLDGKLKFETAMPYDLMSLLAGDFHVVPQKGVGVFLEASRVGEKRPTADGYEAEFRVERAEVRDAQGQAAKNVPNAIMWTIFASMEEHQDVTEDGFTQSFVATGGMTRAQDILRAAASFRLDENERIDWKSIGANLDAVLSCGELASQLGNHFGSFIRYVFHQQPRKQCAFLPSGWRHASASR